MSRECDVLIIGAGMAGACLARQLRRQQPDLKIINIEKREDFDYWIGESTVEVWVDYAYRVLGLGPYLMKNHITKHGLRFFYDSVDKALPIHEMSENGRDHYTELFNSHQLDRQRFDRDLAAMNRADGVEVLMGTGLAGPPADAIAIDRDRGHIVRTTAGPIRCRWLVDAAGRASPLAHKLDLVEDETRHPSSSYWARFRNTRTIDDLGPDAWRRRNNYTLRQFSTNHMMYRGYWWWLIPLSEDVISIGVETDRRLEPRKCKNVDDLVAWMKEHRWGRDVLGDRYEALDFMAFALTARRAKQYYSRDRWFLTGMSGLVIDALYSTTGITTAFSNRLVGELIRTDRSGDSARFERQLHHFNIFMRMRYEGFLSSISNYDRHGSFEVMNGMRSASQNSYHNVRVPEGTEDLRTVIETADRHADSCDCSLEHNLATHARAVVPRVVTLATELTAYLDRTGNYYAKNRGGFTEATERESLRDKYFQTPRDLAAEAAENRITWEASFRHFLRALAAYEHVAWNEPAFDAWFERDYASSTQTLADGLAMLRAAGPGPDSDPEQAWTTKGPVGHRPTNMTLPRPEWNELKSRRR